MKHQLFNHLYSVRTCRRDGVVILEKTGQKPPMISQNKCQIDLATSTRYLIETDDSCHSSFFDLLFDVIMETSRIVVVY